VSAYFEQYLVSSTSCNQGYWQLLILRKNLMLDFPYLGSSQDISYQTHPC